LEITWQTEYQKTIAIIWHAHKLPLPKKRQPQKLRSIWKKTDYILKVGRRFKVQRPYATGIRTRRRREASGKEASVTYSRLFLGIF
jgi:hypothetical protein